MNQDYDVEQEKVRIEWAESNSNKNLNPDSNQNCGSTFRVISKAKKRFRHTYQEGPTSFLELAHDQIMACFLFGFLVFCSHENRRLN